MLGKPLLEGHGEPPDPVKLKAPLIGPISREWLIYILAFVGLAAVWLLVRRYDWVGYLLGAGSVAVLTYVGWHMVAKCGRVERDRLLLAMLLVLGAVVFFTLFEQAGTSLNLFANRNTDLNVLAAPVTWSAPFGKVVFGTAAQLAAAGIDASKVLWVDMTVTAAQTQSFNAGFILIFAPMFAALWAKLGKAGREPDPLFKFGLGLLQVGLGFLVLVWGAGTADAAFRLPLILLGVTYLLHTTGELCLSPVGLSEITKLSPAMIVSTMMAVWFLASSWAAVHRRLGGGLGGIRDDRRPGGRSGPGAEDLARACSRPSAGGGSASACCSSCSARCSSASRTAPTTRWPKPSRFKQFQSSWPGSSRPPMNTALAGVAC